MVWNNSNTSNTAASNRTVTKPMIIIIAWKHSSNHIRWVFGWSGSNHRKNDKRNSKPAWSEHRTALGMWVKDLEEQMASDTTDRWEEYGWKPKKTRERERRTSELNIGEACFHCERASSFVSQEVNDETRIENKQCRIRFVEHFYPRAHGVCVVSLTGHKNLHYTWKHGWNMLWMVYAF